MPPDQRTRLADYLVAGMPYQGYMGYAWCRFLCGVDPPRMGSRDLTDDTWVWPEGLAHYVRDHGILLPEDFVRDALSKSTPVIPGWAEQRALARKQHEYWADDDFWERWCAPRRSPQVLERLRAGRLAAEALAAADSAAKRSDQIAALVAKRGLGDTPCLWRGCAHKALAGLHICAEHSVEVPADPKGRLPQELRKILIQLTPKTADSAADTSHGTAT